MRGGGGRQLEATVHTSLPPRVQGPLRAYVRVCLPAIHWEYSVGPPASKLCVGMRWWGEESSGTVFRVPVVQGQRRCSSEESTTLAFFPVRSALPQLSAYLKDMKSLKLRVGLGHMTDDSMVIGLSTLPDLSTLTKSQPYEDSLPIIGTQGHRLGRLQVQIELQVARAGQTRLTTPAAASDDLSHPPEFKVGPGGHRTTEKQREPTSAEIDTHTTLPPQEHRATSSHNSNRGHTEPKTYTESAASHKAALLAKYINPSTSNAGQEQMTVVPTGSGSTTGQSVSGEMGSAVANPLGPKQQEVIAELIERGERLREAMARAVLDSGIEKKERGGKGGRVPLCGVVGEVYSSEEEEEEDGDVSMDYPLRDPSLLEKLLHSRDVETGKTRQDFGTQTHSPTTDFPSGSKSTAQLDDLHHRPSSPPPSPPSHSSKLEAGGSLSTLASFFSGHSLQKATDAEILQAVGVERLTLLGRVTSCRVVIDILEVDPLKMAAVLGPSGKKRQYQSGPLSNSLSGTFFVEYHFPAAVSGRGGRGRKGRVFPPPHEVVRVASRKIKKKVVRFGHRSVFPVSLAGPVTRQWWHDVLIFAVYYRPPTDRAPCLVGKARVPFRQWLMAGASSTVVAPVTTSGLGAKRDEDGDRADTDEDIIGKLTVCLQLLCGKGADCEVLSAEPPTAVREPEADRGSEREKDTARETAARERDSEILGAAPPIRVTESQTGSAKDIDRQFSQAVQLLLMVPEATDMTLPRQSPPPTSPSSSRDLAPNCYLVCRLFCASPHPKTPTIWASNRPQFNFKQVFPLYLTPSLLDKVCNNFTVVEVWHKTPGTNTNDELLGLVKLSLHQFYLAFSEDSSASLCLRAQLPVVAVDSYCPVISPFTGNEQGHLAVLLAMGSAQQVAEIQQQLAAGNYKLHRPFSKAQTLPAPTHELPVVHQIGRPREESDCEKRSGPIHHTFTVTVSGVRGLSVFNNTVWGEADCFVQYHFPSLTNQPHSRDGEGEGDERERVDSGSEVSLQLVRTDMTLCVPNPAFSHETSHSLPLPPGHPVQREILRRCGPSGGVEFQLWRRFYYPNIRDQLIAKASLPVAKLCALVSMQRISGPTVQSFSLPMTLVDKEVQEGGSGGILEVTLQYQVQGGERLHQPVAVSGERDRTHVSLRVEVVRATGLRDAASLVAQEQPVPLGFAAEVGTNCYAKISLPGLIEKEGRCTKTVMRSFSPEFSHTLEFALPLTSRETVSPSHTASVPLAQRLGQSSGVVEVWHKVPRTHSRPVPTAPRAVFGRSLAPVFRDVCLAQTVVPLISLLERQTGVSGWFPLYSPAPKSNATPPPEELPPDTGALCHVGGIEVSFSFSGDEDRELVLSHGVEMGWVPPQGSRISLEGGLPVRERREREEADMKDSKTCWKFSVKVTDLCVPMEAVTIDMSEDPAPYMYCFLRYRFFDSEVVLSVPRALSYSRDGRGCYQLNHHSTVTVSGSHDLEWYINEESLEVEVWSSPSKRHHHHQRKERHHHRRSDHNHQMRRGGETAESEDTLLGTAFLSLRGLLSSDSVSGSCPVFKAGEDSLGGQRVTVEVERSLVESTSGSPQPTLLEILDVCDDSGGCEVDFVPLKPISEGEEEEEERGKEGVEKEDEKFEDMFEARLVIHEALHLPMMTDKTQEREWAPNAYVSLHPHPKVERIATGAVPSSQTPLWNHHTLTHIPNLYLDPHCVGLELQVWSQADASDQSPESQQGDMYIGCAHVDLSTLALGLPQVSGWYNISDFGGQIQGQLKVSVVPSPGWSSQSKSTRSLPPPHLVLSGYSTISTQLSSDPLVQNSSGHHSIQPAPSFLEKSSSVLLRKLRDDLNELDQISSAWRTNTGAQIICSQPSLHTHCLPALTEGNGGSCITTSQQVSLSVSYSSSGPSLEQRSPTVEQLGDALKESAGEEKDGHPVVLVTAAEPESGSESYSTVSSPGESPSEVASGEISLTTLEISASPLTTTSAQDTLSTSHEAHTNTLHQMVSSVGNSMSVEVDGTMSLELISAGNSLETSEANSRQSDVSSCSDEEDTLSVTPHAAAEASHGGDESRETTTVTPTLNQLFLERTEKTEREKVDKILPVESPRASSSGETGLLDVENATEPHRLSPVTEPQQQPTAPVIKQSAGVPEVALPNFFMPPLELERAMRSLRASALARPPPRTLFHTLSTPPHLQERDASGGDATPSTSPPSLRTPQDVDQFLRSRRHQAGGKNHRQTPSDKDTQRLSRIFSSKPLQTTN